ncbi:hypothetical protein T458_09045 [Brevibacillus panacihumi W25]|uniref:Uncharacterized protein n=1 Tax=Brevibacillus panacihumi W25 TaxID=1408254 RepID=V6MI18_9BACL|nr:hypothetical protein [Brevibacillus panacihumi]EST55053.1 hypothetical protein T458_09045 [Brevibacillus panacihumi W25]
MKRFGRIGCFNVIALVIALLTGSSCVAISPPQASAASEMAGPQDPKEVEQFADDFFNRPEIKEHSGHMCRITSTFRVVFFQTVIFSSQSVL